MERRELIFNKMQQKEWQWMVIVALFLTGTGSGSFLLASIPGFVLGMIVGVVLVMAGSLFLLLDLASPLAAWRLIARPQSSWVSRGVIGISSYALLGALYIFFLLQSQGWASLGAPWSSGPSWLIVLGILAGLGSFFVTTYPGFLLGNMRSMSFWNTALLPVIFLTSSLIGGFGVLYLLPLNWQGLPWLPYFKNFGAGLVVFELILLLGLIWLSSPGAARDSVNLLTRGSLRFQFFFGLLGLGIFVPLALLGLVSLGVRVDFLMLIEGLLHLTGVFFLRYIIVRAAVQVSPR